MELTKIHISSNNEEIRKKIINILSKELDIKKVSEPYKSGKYYRTYLDINDGGVES